MSRCGHFHPLGIDISIDEGRGKFQCYRAWSFGQGLHNKVPLQYLYSPVALRPFPAPLLPLEEGLLVSQTSALESGSHHCLSQSHCLFTGGEVAVELPKGERARYMLVQWSMGEADLQNAFEKLPSTACPSSHFDHLST